MRVRVLEVRRWMGEPVELGPFVWGCREGRRRRYGSGRRPASLKEGWPRKVGVSMISREPRDPFYDSFATARRFESVWVVGETLEARQHQ
jgi:hypothetical protein